MNNGLPRSTSALFDSLESSLKTHVEQAGDCPICGLPKEGIRKHVGGTTVVEDGAHEKIIGGMAESARSAGLCEHIRAFFWSEETDLRKHSFQCSIVEDVIDPDIDHSTLAGLAVILNDGTRATITAESFGLSSVEVVLVDPKHELSKTTVMRTAEGRMAA